MFSASQSECKNLIKTLVALRYYPDNKPWDGELIRNPSWEQVESVIRRMDDFCFPLVALSLNSCLAVSDVFEDDDSFHVIGGNDRFALFQNAGNWQYDNPRMAVLTVSVYGKATRDISVSSATLRHCEPHWLLSESFI